MDVLLVNPRGFCAGVDRAIAIVERALELFGAPVYVRHEIVHNRHVVGELRRRGAIFVEELDEIPDGAIAVYSAHGVARAVHDEGKQRDLKVFDATCPLVTKVHMEVVKHCRAGRDVVLIGHAGHPEVAGTLGQWDAAAAAGDIFLVESIDDVADLRVNTPDAIAYVTQTTLSVDDTRAIIEALEQRFPDIIGPRRDDICYATQNRQDAVRRAASECDVLLVVGSANSSNSNRLRELAEKSGVPAYLIDGAQDIDRAWLAGAETVGVTAGASAPESLVQAVVDQLQQWGAGAARPLESEPERITFALPRELRVAVNA